LHATQSCTIPAPPNWAASQRASYEGKKGERPWRSFPLKLLFLVYLKKENRERKEKNFALFEEKGQGLSAALSLSRALVAQIGCPNENKRRE
jgi:hypothetical protein